MQKRLNSNVALLALCLLGFILTRAACATVGSVEATLAESPDPTVVVPVQAEPTEEGPPPARPIPETDGIILRKIAMAEAEGESIQGKALVMLVVLNRVADGRFPDNVADVVFQNSGGVYQFSPVMEDGRYWTTYPDNDCQKALELVETGWDESGGALYFDSGADSWQARNCEYVTTCGNHSFYR